MEASAENDSAIIIRHMDQSWGDRWVHDNFDKFGAIVSLYVPRGRNTRRNDIAYIEFATKEAASAAIQTFNLKRIDNRILSVEFRNENQSKPGKADEDGEDEAQNDEDKLRTSAYVKYPRRDATPPSGEQSTVVPRPSTPPTPPESPTPKPPPEEKPPYNPSSSAPKAEPEAPTPHRGERADERRGREYRGRSEEYEDRREGSRRGYSREVSRRDDRDRRGYSERYNEYGERRRRRTDYRR